MKILITGSGGLIGSALIKSLEDQDHEIIRLVRTPAPAERTVILWEPESEKILDHSRFEGLDAVVHLAGENVASGKWTTDKKARIRNSRVQGTALIAQTLAARENKPKVFLSASAVGFYGDRGNEVLTEESPCGTGFLPGVCRDWEAATQTAGEAGIRVVNLRIGMVLAAHGGALLEMIKPFKFGMGGVIGSGKQYYSWVDIEDTTRAIQFILANETVRGPVNITAPQPVTNREFTRNLGALLSKPTLLPLPAFAARALLGELADGLVLASTRAHPEKLLRAGFTFSRPTLEESLRYQFSLMKDPTGEASSDTTDPD